MGRQLLNALFVADLISKKDVRIVELEQQLERIKEQIQKCKNPTRAKQLERRGFKLFRKVRALKNGH